MQKKMCRIKLECNEVSPTAWKQKNETINCNKNIHTYLIFLKNGAKLDTLRFHV